MTNELAVFNYRGGDVRIVEGEDGNLWWVAKDVAERLGYVWNGAQVVAHVPEEWRGGRSILTPPRSTGNYNTFRAGFVFLP